MTSSTLEVRAASNAENTEPIPRWRRLLEEARYALANAVEATVDPHLCRPMPGQPRTYFDPIALTALSESIELMGQVTSGIVRKVKSSSPILYEILDGERRQRACIMINRTFKVQVTEVGDEAARYIIAAVANFNKAPHTPIEISDSIERMKQLEIPIAEIGKLLGMTAVWAYQLHSLQNLDPKVRAMMDPGLAAKDRLQVTAAIQISKVKDSVSQIDLAERVIARVISLQDLRRTALDVSVKAGVPMRVNRRQPKRHILSITSAARGILRTSRDMQARLKEEGAEQALTMLTPVERRAVLKDLTSAVEVIQATAQVIQDPK